MPLGPFRLLSKIRVDICRYLYHWHRWQMEKIFNQKSLIILFGHLWEVELTYRDSFAFKFTLRSQQPDIVPIVCRQYCWHRWQIATGNNNTCETGGKICRRCRWHQWQICHRCRWYPWCTLTCEYLRQISKKFKTVLMGDSGAGGKLIHGKTRSKKSRDTVPLRRRKKETAPLRTSFQTTRFSIEWRTLQHSNIAWYIYRRIYQHNCSMSLYI